MKQSEAAGLNAVDAARYTVHRNAQRARHGGPDSAEPFIRRIDMQKISGRRDLPSRKRGTIAGLFAVAACALLLAGCASSSLDDVDGAQPAGSAFDRALYKDYAALAHGFGANGGGRYDDFWADPLGYLGLYFWQTSPNDMLVKAFSDKALLAAQGQDVAPEQASDAAAQAYRARLVRAVASGSGRFPDEAARAQANYDCWMLTAMIPSQSAASSQCRTAFGGDIAQLEAKLRPALPPPPVAQAPAAGADYTVYFDFDSWSLSAEDLAVLTKVIETARAGGQTRIAVVGHTDTSGPAAYNRKLSVRRANVVVEALVDMGARREAIRATGVGETDLAVQTPDGVREAKNRRAVIDLLP
ncbi:MAG: OmpA family protein [Alphaproteobacteria bacterium]|nr:OmpA family protein [Alphaproteobacteria bacterium]MDE2111314.1 OmpA family protein [Alphaproteobacteria bacterium]MDE2495633.1 OmpA family protein [Alphaproteobacteria bacterium]